MVPPAPTLLLRELHPLLAATRWAGPVVAWTGAVTALLLGMVAGANGPQATARRVDRLADRLHGAGRRQWRCGRRHLQLVAHAAAKSGLFLAAGAWLDRTGHQTAPFPARGRAHPPPGRRLLHRRGAHAGRAAAAVAVVGQGRCPRRSPRREHRPVPGRARCGRRRRRLQHQGPVVRHPARCPKPPDRHPTPSGLAPGESPPPRLLRCSSWQARRPSWASSPCRDRPRGCATCSASRRTFTHGVGAGTGRPHHRPRGRRDVLVAALLPAHSLPPVVVRWADDWLLGNAPSMPSSSGR